MLVSGITENKENAIYYYMYDLETDEFTEERCDRKLIHPFRDRQGNRDYSKLGRIYCQLSENKVKAFNKRTYYWDNMSVYLMRVYQEKMELGKNANFNMLKSLGCGGDKKKDTSAEPPKQQSDVKTELVEPAQPPKSSVVVSNPPK